MVPLLPRALAPFHLLFPTSMHSLGRLLQLVGLTVPPLAIVLQLLEALTLGQMLIALLGAVAAFGMGRILEGYARV